MNNRYTLIFRTLLKNSGITEWEEEHKFNPSRRYRFDFALLKDKCAFELEGGVWSKGRHVRPKGFLNDCEKYNLATMMGWRVYRIPTTWLDKSEKLLEVIRYFRG